MKDGRAWRGKKERGTTKNKRLRESERKRTPSDQRRKREG